MRNTRKWLVLLLTVVMLVNTMGINVMAAENESPVALSVSRAADSGSTVQVQILAAEAQTVADGKLVVTYDAEKLTYNDTVSGAAWGEDQVTLSVNPTDGKVILAFANANAAAEGVLFTLTFTASGDAVVALDGSSYITGVDADLAQEVSTCPSARFSDLGSLFPEAHDAVDYMVSHEYMIGMSQTMFGPHADLNRAQMVTILYRIAGNPAVEGAPVFTDVPADVFYTAPVIWAAQNGITNGLSEYLFGPNKALSRQELVTFLYRFAKYMDYDVTMTTDLSGYTDASKVPSYAVEAFQWAVASGVVNGTSETTLSPADNTTRTQICLMIQRLLTAQD